VAHAGRWHLLLTIHPEFWKRAATGALAEFKGAGVHYSASVSAYSNLRMAAAVHQSSRQPGAALTLRAVITEYGAPFKGHAVVQAELLRPDMTPSLVVLHEVAGEPGAFQATRIAAQSGIYRFRFIASGRNSREQPFTREALRTAAVWRGGDFPGGGPKDSGADNRRPDWCALLECLFAHGVLSDDLAKRLKHYGVDIDRLRGCLARQCRDPGVPTMSASERDSLLTQLREIIRMLG
jgi:hypothetical protein